MLTDPGPRSRQLASRSALARRAVVNAFGSLAYTGSVLALTLSAGVTAGVGIVVLAPLVWTALFNRRWESACVVAAIVAVEVVISLDQLAPAAVTACRVPLWGLLGALSAIATHGPRDRIQRSRAENAQLQERLGELRVVRERDRLATDLQSSVDQRIFAAGLTLQGVLLRTADAEAQRLLESTVADLDEALKLLRQAIFGLERRLDSGGLRHQVLQLCAGLSPAPEISFAGWWMTPSSPPLSSSRSIG